MKVLRSYPNTDRGQNAALAYKQGWEDAYSRHSERYDYERVEIEFSTINVKVVLYRGLIKDDGSVAWEDQSQYLFAVGFSNGSALKVWKSGEDQSSARQVVWDSLSDEQRNDVEDIECVEIREAGVMPA